LGCDVAVEGLEKVYPGGVWALRGVSFRVSRGERFAVMGPNGSGKTTLLQAVAGVTRPTRGRVYVCGYEVWGEGWVRARSLVGFAPQEPPLPRRLTVIEALEVLGGLLGLGLRSVRREAERILEELGLPREALRVRVGRLSGGQVRRVSIALALLGEPEVVVLDEPGSGLDPSAKRRLWRDAGGLLRGRTVLFSTHDPVEAEEAPDRVAILHRGVLAALGRPQELIERHAPGLRVRVWAPRHPSTLKPRRLGRGFAEYAVESERDVAAVVGAYAEEGVAVERVEVARPGLREVFFEVTGEPLDR
jgi:ABC-2 type transport system ATP-binding protein